MWYEKVSTMIPNVQGYELADLRFLSDGSTVYVISPVERAKCWECRSELGESNGANEPRLIRDLPNGEFAVWLEVRRRRGWCPKCGKVVSEHLHFVDGKNRFTRRLEKHLASFCDQIPVHTVERLTGMDKNVLYGIDRRKLEERMPASSLDSLERIGIDEKMVGRKPRKVTRRKRSKNGRRKLKKLTRYKPVMATLIYDLDRSQVVKVAEGRSYRVAMKLLRSLGKDVLGRIKAVCLDMAAPFIKAVKTALPNAVMVFDRFHVKRYVQKALDAVRKAEQGKLTKEEAKILFQCRWIFLRSDDNLRKEERVRLSTLLEKNKKLFKARTLRGAFDAIYLLQDKGEAEKAFRNFIRQCSSSRLQPFVELAKKIANWLPGIMTFWDDPVTNAVAEGINNRIGELIRRSYGFRDMAYLFAKIQLVTGFIESYCDQGYSVIGNPMPSVA